MLLKPKKPCKHPGCPELAEKKYCEQHQKLRINNRENASERGYDSRLPEELWKEKASQQTGGNALICSHEQSKSMICSRIPRKR